MTTKKEMEPTVADIARAFKAQAREFIKTQQLLNEACQRFANASEGSMRFAQIACDVANANRRLQEVQNELFKERELRRAAEYYLERHGILKPAPGSPNEWRDRISKVVAEADEKPKGTS